MPLVHPFVFFQRPRSDRELRVSRHVDGTALMNVAAALQPQGYSIGAIHLNYPPRQKAADALEVALDGFAPGDLILSATRLELKPKLACRKVVMMAGTPIERLIEAAWSEVLQSSERLLVVLKEHTARWLAPGFEDRGNIEFNEREGAFYTGLARAKPSVRATAAYLLRTRELWPGGPGYLGFFGMDSTTAAAWSHLLRHRHADLLESEGFVMAELSGKLPGRVSNLDWALDWSSRVVLRAPDPFAPSFSSAQNRGARPAA
jgi:hypothetical protein